MAKHGWSTPDRVHCREEWVRVRLKLDRSHGSAADVCMIETLLLLVMEDVRSWVYVMKIWDVLVVIHVILLFVMVFVWCSSTLLYCASTNRRWIFQTTMDGERTKIEDVHLEKPRNFVVDNFFIWNHLVKKNYVWIFKILKFELFKRPQMDKQ